jgi:hypothetical protein
MTVTLDKKGKASSARETWLEGLVLSGSEVAALHEAGDKLEKAGSPAKG